MENPVRLYNLGANPSSYYLSALKQAFLENLTMLLYLTIVPHHATIFHENSWSISWYIKLWKVGQIWAHIEPILPACHKTESFGKTDWCYFCLPALCYATKFHENYKGNSWTNWSPNCKFPSTQDLLGKWTDDTYNYILCSIML